MNTILILDENRGSRKKWIEIILDVNPELECYETRSANDAYLYIQEHEVKAIVMDIQAKNYDGLAFAKKVRQIEAYYLLPIVIITKDQQHKMEAYENIQCYSYMEKPVDLEAIRDVFERLKIGYKELLKQNNRRLRITSNKLEVSITMDRIKYVEYCNRKVKIVTESEEYEYSHLSLKKVLPLLTDSFIRIHQSFIINTTYVHKIDYSQNLLWVEGVDRKIPIGRTYVNLLKKRTNMKSKLLAIY